MQLDTEEQALLAGGAGEAASLAMRLLIALGEATGASRMVKISSAHIDSCLYHGRAGLELAERLVAGGGRVRVPTTLNVAALDLLHPSLVRVDAETRALAKRQMDAYVALGGAPTFTCAPYQLPQRPAPGDHVAWAESNAIVFANSVLGARTERYGDFSDICAAITGCAPYAGLHVAANRRARVVFELPELSAEAWRHRELYAVIGHVVGLRAGARVPAIVGVPESAGEDDLKQLGAAAASSGAVAMCHVVGVTPEAPTLASATGGRPARRTRLTRRDLRAAWRQLSSVAGPAPPSARNASTGAGPRLDAVSLGTPHMSLAELSALAPRLERLRIADGVTLYVSTARHVVEELAARGLFGAFERPGVVLVTDTCTYVTPILADDVRLVMTNSAKWAWYAPANLGVDVVFGTLDDCLTSAEAGRVEREPPRWLDG
jgi:predicted aconitase